MSIFRNINRSDIFVGIWALYKMQGILYPQGIINQLLQLAMIILMLFECMPFLSGVHLPTRSLRAARYLLFMFIAYGGLLILENPVGTKGGPYLYLQNALNSILPIFLFYKYATKGLLTEYRMRLYLLLFIPIVYLNSQYQIAQKIEESLTNKTEFTDNSGYDYLAILPLVASYYKKPLIQFALSCVIFLLILQAMKRGAILIGALCLLYFLYQGFKTNKSTLYRSLFVALAVISVIGAIYAFQYLLSNSIYFAYRFESTLDGDTSGRDVLYTGILDAFLNEGNPIFLLFGHGAFHTYLEIGNYAHQDWLETLYNNGIFGIIILFSFFYGFYSDVRFAYKYNTSPIVVIFGMALIVCLVKTMFSMSILELTPPMTMAMGFMAYIVTQNQNSI